MTVGRIQTYMHSDKTTPNKGGAMIRVTSDTDFAAKTPEFIEFTEHAAKLAFAVQATSWADVVEAFPDTEDKRIALEKTLKEKIIVDTIAIMVL